nr:hypothetical protein A4A49_14615 [Ipomoea batatas]
MKWSRLGLYRVLKCTPLAKRSGSNHIVTFLANEVEIDQYANVVYLALVMSHALYIMHMLTESAEARLSIHATYIAWYGFGMFSKAKEVIACENQDRWEERAPAGKRQAAIAVLIVDSHRGMTDFEKKLSELRLDPFNEMGSSQIAPSTNSSPRGCSKAQNSLLNILRIISTFPPEETPESEYDEKKEVKVFGIDLNVFGTEKLCERSELSGGKGKGEEGFMGLLIEAARLIFGEFNDKKYGGAAGSITEQEPEKNTSESQNSDETKMTAADPGRRMKRRPPCWAVELYGNAEEEEQNVGGEASPVVRSKRGRIQVLPCKYRDSVLEPLTRFTRTRSTTILANRRRSR